MTKNIKNNNSGFTLIELLIVILIISVLAGAVISLTNSGGIRQKGKDAQRIGDLKKIQTALELYYSDNRQYPAQATWQIISNTSGTLFTNLKPSYMNTIPVDPINNASAGSDACATGTAAEYAYFYKTSASAGAYAMVTFTEVSSSADDSKCNQLNNWTTYCPSNPNATNCYGVQNP